jgi:hypothetical protein
MPDISFLIPSRLIGWYDIVKDFQSLAVGVIGFGSIFVKDIGLLEPQQVALVIRAYGANRHLDMTLSRRARQTNFVAGDMCAGGTVSLKIWRSCDDTFHIRPRPADDDRASRRSKPEPMSSSGRCNSHWTVIPHTMHNGFVEPA